MGTAAAPVLSRLLDGPVLRALAVFPAVVVTGSRQTGKTTLVRHRSGRSYFSLDDLDVFEQARKTPHDLLSRGEQVTLDEVQRAPELLLAIKRSVDEARTPGRFLLTGSNNILLSHRIAETLAGRAAFLTLWPMTSGELAGEGRAGLWTDLLAAPPARWLDRLPGGNKHRDWKDLARRGGYPPAAALPGEAERSLWFASYTQTYLERDLRDLARIENLVDFRRLMRAACLRLGGLLNQTELARDSGLPRGTVQRYLDLLEASYQVIRLEPYSVNRTKRLIKAPKLYWGDTGLALDLAGETDLSGAHLENVVLGDLLSWRDADPERPAVLYWRTAAGEEVDFVLERKSRLLAIEVKTTTHPTHHDARHLQAFLAEYGKSAHGALLLHTGLETQWLAERVLAVPWWRVL